jgi:hypothetical protein
MVDLASLHQDVNAEISAILSSDFNIEVTNTNSVPHSDDTAITFPNIDTKTQGAKLIETTVLHVDMRRSTTLSMKHRPPDGCATLLGIRARGNAVCRSFWWRGERHYRRSRNGHF